MAICQRQERSLCRDGVRVGAPTRTPSRQRDRSCLWHIAIQWRYFFPRRILARADLVETPPHGSRCRGAERDSPLGKVSLPAPPRRNSQMSRAKYKQRWRRLSLSDGCLLLVASCVSSLDHLIRPLEHADRNPETDLFR